MKLIYTVTDDNIMIKDYFKHLAFSKKFSKKVKLYGKMIVNGQEVKNYYNLHKNDILEVVLDEKMNDEILPSEIELDIIYEDEVLLVINKANNISCQPSRKHITDNLISALKQHFIENNISGNVHLVNRLDYNTTGLMVIAKSGFIHNCLQKKITRKYLCLVEGIFGIKKGIINLPIKRKPSPSILREISIDGKEAITHYQVLQEYENKSIVDVELETGRTHQIRLHMSHLKHPILGDKLYGSGNEDLKLHSYYLSFIHPLTNETKEFYNYPLWYKEE